MNSYLFIFIMLAAPMLWADDLDRVAAKKQIVIGVRGDKLPFGYLDKNRGSVVGYDIEFAEYVARKLGATPTFKIVYPSGDVSDLNAGRVDILFSSFAKNVERGKDVDLSVGYFVGTQKMLSKKGAGRNLNQLAEIAVCVARGEESDRYLKDLSPTVRIRNFDNYSELFLALRDGRCEYAAGAEATMLAGLAKTHMNRRADFELVEVPIYSAGYLVGAQKMIAKKGTPHDFDRLGKLPICFLKGESSATYLWDSSAAVQIRNLDSYDEIFTALYEGKCEFASGSEAPLQKYLSSLPNGNGVEFELSGVPIASEVYGVAMRKGESRLQHAVNDALVEAEKTGVAAKIFDHWFGPDSLGPLNRYFKIMK